MVASKSHLNPEYKLWIERLKHWEEIVRQRQHDQIIGKRRDPNAVKMVGIL
jgi:hypothetical protein